MLRKVCRGKDRIGTRRVRQQERNPQCYETPAWPAFGKDWVVMPTQARTVELELAIYQSGYTVAAIGHLSGIGSERLAKLIAGATPTKQERETLKRLLAHWQPLF